MYKFKDRFLYTFRTVMEFKKFINNLFTFETERSARTCGTLKGAFYSTFKRKAYQACLLLSKCSREM
jgi:hypothetical protein